MWDVPRPRSVYGGWRTQLGKNPLVQTTARQHLSLRFSAFCLEHSQATREGQEAGEGGGCTEEMLIQSGIPTSSYDSNQDPLSSVQV